VITAASRPRLAGKARLRFDAPSGKHMLLYPERGLELTDSAAKIAQLLGESLTVREIVDKLHASFAGAERARVEADVLSFLRSLAERGLLVEDAA
jgi:coenzyme PQQ biosynthesis protein PqqD